METSKKTQATSDYQKQLEKAIEMSKTEYKVIFSYVTYDLNSKSEYFNKHAQLIT